MIVRESGITSEGVVIADLCLAKIQSGRKIGRRGGPWHVKRYCWIWNLRIAITGRNRQPEDRAVLSQGGVARRSPARQRGLAHDGGCKPLFNDWDSFVTQDKSWQHVEELRFCQQSLCRLGQIISNVLQRFRIAHNIFLSFDDGQKVFQIVACLKVLAGDAIPPGRNTAMLPVSGFAYSTVRIT